MKLWCARCNQKVSTWQDSYVENKVKVTTTLCGQCNAVLKVERKALK